MPGAPLTFQPRVAPPAARPGAAATRFHLWTIGCQMNVADADYLTELLTTAGFRAAATPDESDLAILVTCCVRQNAEQKVYGKFRELKAWKRAQEGRAIAMTGCMANKEGDRLFARLPDLDYRFDVREAPAFVRDLQGDFTTDPASTGGAVLQRGVTAFLPVIYGCNEVCSFCVVPYVRGVERSRPLPEIVEEVRRLAAGGVKEVTLLGQTVNSYRCPQTGARLADLLAGVDAVPGLVRVRFLTSHPRHVTDELLLAIRDLPKVCEHLHLPVQSGDDIVLKHMRRRYTHAEYEAIVARARALIPDLALSTDIIVGYCGENETQFAQTQALLERVRWDVIHVQGFSPRPRTTAGRLPDDVPPAEKKRRINLLLEAQRRIADELNRRWRDREVEVLVERRQDDGLWAGRTRGNKTVVFSDSQAAAGTLRRVRIDETTAWQLRGVAVPERPAAAVPAGAH
jgi:tRNA-2-methylthio-N6-dimethylallyladenosine synthase